MTNEQRARKWLRDTGHSQFKEHVELLTALLDEAEARGAQSEPQRRGNPGGGLDGAWAKGGGSR